MSSCRATNAKLAEYHARTKLSRFDEDLAEPDVEAIGGELVAVATFVRRRDLRRLVRVARAAIAYREAVDRRPYDGCANAVDELFEALREGIEE